MKPVLLTFLLTVQFSLYSQVDRFNKGFNEGYYIKPDNSKEYGFLKVYLAQDNKLKSKKSPNSEIIKLSPEGIKGFTIDTLKFRCLRNVKAIGALGIKKPIKAALLKSWNKVKWTYI